MEKVAGISLERSALFDCYKQFYENHILT